MSAHEIRLDDRYAQVAERIQLLQDAASVVVLVPAVLAHLRTGGPRVALAAVELAALALALWSAARELRRGGGERERPKRGGLNLYLGVVLLAEHVFRVSAGGKLVSPTALTAITALMLAFAQPRLQERRRRRSLLRVDEHELSAAVGRLRKVRVAWADVAWIEQRRHALVFHLHDGRDTRLGLRRLRNAGEVTAAVRAAAERSNIEWR